MSADDSNLANDVVQQVTSKARDLAKQIANNIGAPVDASKLSRSEVARLWNLGNPKADPMQVQQLLAAGQHSKALDLAYPWRNKLLGQGDPQKRVDNATTFSRWASGQLEDDANT